MKNSWAKTAVADANRQEAAPRRKDTGGRSFSCHWHCCFDHVTGTLFSYVFHS